MKQILVFIFDGYADWEPAYVCAQLNAPATGYAVKTIGLDRAPKVSMGGFRVTPDFTVADYPRDAGLLLLTGGTGTGQMPYPGGCNLQRGKLPGGKRFFRPAQTYWEYPALPQIPGSAL